MTSPFSGRKHPDCNAARRGACNCPVEFCLAKWRRSERRRRYYTVTRKAPGDVARGELLDEGEGTAERGDNRLHCNLGNGGTWRQRHKSGR